MSGPIVRSAPSKKFTANWDAVFGAKSKGKGTAKASKSKKSKGKK